MDPGLGFAKTAEHNWQLMGALPALTGLAPVLVGASRKAFLGALLADGAEPRPAKERDAATSALTVVAAQAGAWAVRVHEVSASADAVRVVTALRRAASRQAAPGDSAAPRPVAGRPEAGRPEASTAAERSDR